MTMPVDLVLVRHGESQGNVATKLSKTGDNSYFTEEFLSNHSSLWDLTDRGRDQAKAAGDALREMGLHFNRCYTSEYLRTMRTAQLLDLPAVKWYTYFLLHERDWGDLDVMTEEEKQRLFAKSLARRKQDPFYWTPPNGESMTDLCLRIKDVLGTLHRECSDKRVIASVHGEVMWAFRVNIERMTTIRFKELDHSQHPFDRIHNCQILHYTRVNPLTGDLSDHLDWMRSICPWDPTLSSNEWQEIVRPKFSNDQLGEEMNKMLTLTDANGGK